jgi:hypothetical protein
MIRCGLKLALRIVIPRYGLPLQGALTYSAIDWLSRREWNVSQPDTLSRDYVDVSALILG